MELNFQDTRAMKRRDETAFTTVLIDSRDRDPRKFPHPSAYTIDLPHTLHHVTEAKLVSAELPSTMYAFAESEGNTRLDVEVQGARRTVTLPDGNYGIETMMDALVAALESTFADQGRGFSAAANASSLRVTLEVDDPTVSFRVYTSDYLPNATHWGLAYYLGFDRDRVYEGVDGRIVGTRPMSLHPVTYLLLDIEEFGTVQESEPLGRGGSASLHTFAKVPMKADRFEYAFFDKVITHNTFRPPIPRLQKLRIAWRHHSGRPVEFHGLDHAFTIQITHTPIRSN